MCPAGGAAEERRGGLRASLASSRACSTSSCSRRSCTSPFLSIAACICAIETSSPPTACSASSTPSCLSSSASTALSRASTTAACALAISCLIASISLLVASSSRCMLAIDFCPCLAAPPVPSPSLVPLMSAAPCCSPSAAASSFLAFTCSALCCSSLTSSLALSSSLLNAKVFLFCSSSSTCIAATERPCLLPPLDDAGASPSTPSTVRQGLCSLVSPVMPPPSSSPSLSLGDCSPSWTLARPGTLPCCALPCSC